MPQKTYDIRLPQFEGPFDLLLFFIERDELDIHEISLAAITNDFLHYIHTLTRLDIEVASEFIYVAATLMRIKVRMLLPRPQAETTDDEPDTQQELVNRLIEYKLFKDAAARLRELEESRLLRFKRGNTGFDTKRMNEKGGHTAGDVSSVSVYRLMQAYRRVSGRLAGRRQEVKHVIERYPYTIDEQKKAISGFLRVNKELNFADLQRTCENKVHFIYNFLAILEMLQQQLITIEAGLGYNNFFIAEGSAINT